MDGETGEEASSSQPNTPQQETQSTATTVSISRVNFVPNQSFPATANANSLNHTNAAVDFEALGLRNGSSGGGVDGENRRLQRKWEFFPGKNRFYCDGRVMTAPSIRFCVLSFALILLTFTLFIIFDAPFLTEKLTVAIPIVGSILFVSVIVNMVKTSFSDPGILPRASQQEADHLEKSYYNTNFRPPPRTKDIVVNGQVIKSKYCFTCKMFRPPRASHCGVCDNCVDRFDHHCPFLGNCIGKRNYRSFYTFIVSLSFLAVFVLSASIAHLAMLSKERDNFLEALRDSPSSAIVILISFFGMWTVIGLTGFHTYLIAVEQTTNEDIKGLFGRANAKNPFAHGNFCQNCCFVLCGPSQPSLIDPRGIASPDFIASLPRKSEPSNGMLSPGKTVPLTVKTIANENQNNQQNHGSSFVGGTNKIYREQPPTAQTVQPIQHQPIQLSSTTSSPPSETSNGVHPSIPTFPGLPAVPREEKVLLGQTRNGRTDYRQTVPETSTPEEIQMSQQEALISPSAASTVSLSTLSTSNMSSNDYDTVGSPMGGDEGKVGRAPVPVVNAATVGSSSSSLRQHFAKNNKNHSKRLFPSSSADQLDDIVDPSDFDDDLDMPSLSNINEVEILHRTPNGRPSNSNNNRASLGGSNALTKSTRSLPSTSLADNINGRDINKIHVLESSYPSSSKSSVSSKMTATPSTSSVRNKMENTNGSGGPGRGPKPNNNKRNLESTMQNSPLHLDTIM